MNLKDNHNFLIASLAATLVTLTAVWIWSDAGADSSVSGVVSAVNKANVEGDKERVLAIVDGEPITSGVVSGIVAFSSIPNATDDAGKPLGQLTREQALDRAIAIQVLAAMARRRGIIIPAEEVTFMIKAGQIDILSDKLVPTEYKDMIRAYMSLLGTSPEAAIDDPLWRKRIENGLLADRYMDSIEMTKEEAVANARTTIPVVVVGGTP